eukprot:gene13899-biopygen6548
MRFGAEGRVKIGPVGAGGPGRPIGPVGAGGPGRSVAPVRPHPPVRPVAPGRPTPLHAPHRGVSRAGSGIVWTSFRRVRGGGVGALRWAGR